MILRLAAGDVWTEIGVATFQGKVAFDLNVGGVSVRWKSSAAEARSLGLMISKAATRARKEARPNQARRQPGGGR